MRFGVQFIRSAASSDQCVVSLSAARSSCGLSAEATENTLTIQNYKAVGKNDLPDNRPAVQHRELYLYSVITYVERL